MVVGQAPEKGHCQMGVRIDEPREDDLILKAHELTWSTALEGATREIFDP